MLLERKDNMATDNAKLEGKVCPGCHFQCKLKLYQCGRGKEFRDMALAGEEVPLRRGPGPVFAPSEHSAHADKPKPSQDDRLMHGLNVLANMLQDRHAEAGIHKVAISLANQGLFMSVPMLSKRALIESAELDAILQAMHETGLVLLRDEEGRGSFVELTDVGKAQVQAWRCERAEQTAEFLSPLSDEEKTELESLVRKLLTRH